MTIRDLKKLLFFVSFSIVSTVSWKNFVDKKEYACYSLCMSILYRYYVKEHITPFFLALIVLTFILIMNRVFELVYNIVGKGLSPYIVLKVFILSLPFIIALTVPMAVLVAVITVFGRSSQDFEIIALKTGGINLYKLIIPVLITVTLLSMGMVYFNNHILPESNHTVKNLLIDISEKKPTLRLKEGIFTSPFKGYDIYIRKINPRTSLLYDMLIYESKKGKITKVVIADSGRMGTSQDMIVLTLLDGEIHEIDPKDPLHYRKLSFKKQIITFPINDEFIEKERSYRSDRELSAKAMRQRIATVKDEIEKLEKEHGVASKDIERRIKIKRKEISRYAVEIHKKYSIPFASVVFLFLGVPLGIKTRKGGVAVATAVSIFFFVIYYIFLVGGEELADRGYISPFMGMWLPNIVFFIIGILLTHKSVYENSFHRITKIFKKSRHD
ncbi:MAG: YjgP/YjgQ family permease [Candidatus Cloacimonadota bacterium]|nr:MAG: YjgP/YjgQ family permease [Candidatus Cloacimonadota bacterium]